MSDALPPPPSKKKPAPSVDDAFASAPEVQPQTQEKKVEAPTQAEIQRARLRATDRVQMFTDFALGMSDKDLADKYGVHEATVRGIISTDRWGDHLERFKSLVPALSCGKQELTQVLENRVLRLTSAMELHSILQLHKNKVKDWYERNANKPLLEFVKTEKWAGMVNQFLAEKDLAALVAAESKVHEMLANAVGDFGRSSQEKGGAAAAVAAINVYLPNVGKPPGSSQEFTEVRVDGKIVRPEDAILDPIPKPSKRSVQEAAIEIAQCTPPEMP